MNVVTASLVAAEAERGAWAGSYSLLVRVGLFVLPQKDSMALVGSSRVAKGWNSIVVVMG